jgi:hypothetical protein
MRPTASFSPFAGAIALLAATSLCLPAQDAPAQDAPAPQRPWTFLIYGACDNNAEDDGNFFRFLDGVRSAFADDPGIEVVLFLDRSDRYSTNATSLGEDFTDARLYRVRSGRSERLAGGNEFPEITTAATRPTRPTRGTSASSSRSAASASRRSTTR